MYRGFSTGIYIIAICTGKNIHIHIYIYIVPIRFRIVFSKYFLTLISHDFHPWGCLKFIPLEREKKDRVNKFKANLINPPPGIIP